MNKTIIYGTLIAVSLLLLLRLIQKIKNYINIINYEVHEIKNFLSENECKQIIQLANPTFSRSTVDSDKNPISNVRTSYHTWLKNENNIIIDKISDLAVQVTQLPKENQEDLQVVRYHKGQEYKPHYDACNSKHDKCNKKNLRGGQRYATVIVYLNDNFTGGETFFPYINKKIKPETGKAVIFFNLNKDKTCVHPLSRHGGNPVKDGTKYMCNLWVRLNKFN